jgi:hypothetical protein
VGNAALVYTGSPLSTAGAVACGLNSLAGNIPEQDINQAKRAEANQEILNRLNKFEKPLSENNPIRVENSSDPKDAQANIIPVNAKKGLKNDNIVYPESTANTVSFFTDKKETKNSTGESQSTTLVLSKA